MAGLHNDVNVHLFPGCETGLVHQRYIISTITHSIVRHEMNEIISEFGIRYTISYASIFSL